MSFGFSVCGSAANVQKKAAEAFDKAAENCKNFPSEAESIVLAKQVALKQLEFYNSLQLDESGNAPPGVLVNCSGHASIYGNEGSMRGGSTFTLEIKPLYGYVE